jgi:hypothetical protein
LDEKFLGRGKYFLTAAAGAGMMLLLLLMMMVQMLMLMMLMPMLMMMVMSDERCATCTSCSVVVWWRGRSWRLWLWGGSLCL